MAGETINIAAIAEKVAKDIFVPFGWSIVGPQDLNFECVKKEKHVRQGRKKVEGHFDHKHPCDIVLKYFDPYLNKNILVLTDLKSFSKSSISIPSAKNSLVSLAKALECAHVAPQWRTRYQLDATTSEVRGMLFVFNHDQSYKGNFARYFFEKSKIDDIPLVENQQLHLIGPETITYLCTVLADIRALQVRGEFPLVKQYSFFYPDMTLSKAHGDVSCFPAIIEMLCSSFMVIRYDQYINHTATTPDDQNQPGGFVVYYRNDGATSEEFLYLLDYLSKWQILNSDSVIKLRIASASPNPDIKSNFEKAKRKYLYMWGGDSYREKSLKRVELQLVTTVVPHYSPGPVGWRDQ